MKCCRCQCFTVNYKVAPVCHYEPVYVTQVINIIGFMGGGKRGLYVSRIFITWGFPVQQKQNWTILNRKKK